MILKQMKEEYQKCTDQEIWDYEEKLKTEYETQSYISSKIPLKQEFEQFDSIMSEKLKNLSSQFNVIRYTRRDGNCFYRAIGFLLLQHIFQFPTQCDYQNLFINPMEVYMESVGFQKFVYEDYIDIIKECLRSLMTLNNLEEFLLFFNQPIIADTIVILLRLTTSAYIRLNSEEFLPFIEGLPNIDEFCNIHVENMGRDADHVHITAISKALNLSIHISYLNSRENVPCVFHEFKGESNSLFETVYLLYRPGHYDILEQIENTQ
jgi:ubiquitin thioesterase protein OTUB1